MKPEPTLAHFWLMFERAIIAPEAPEVQRAEMKKSFYAGAAVTFELMDIATAGAEDDAMRQMSQMQREIQVFAHELAVDAYLGETFDWKTKQ